MPKTQQQCKTCNGWGLVKTPIKVCHLCMGKKCIRSQSFNPAMLINCIRSAKTVGAPGLFRKSNGLEIVNFNNIRKYY